MKQNQLATIHSVKNNDQRGWIDAIWTALEGYRENCIPEGDTNHDLQWDELATAMAWITESLGLSSEVNQEMKKVQRNQPNELVLIKTMGKAIPAYKFYTESVAHKFMAENEGWGLIYTNKLNSFCVASHSEVPEISITGDSVFEDISFDDGLKEAIERGIEVYSTMAISTGHMTFDDSRYLDRSENSMVMKRDTGFFIKLYTGEYDLDKNFSDHYSNALKKVIKYAVEGGFELIEFDEAGPVIELFTVFDW